MKYIKKFEKLHVAIAYNNEQINELTDEEKEIYSQFKFKLHDYVRFNVFPDICVISGINIRGVSSRYYITSKKSDLATWTNDENLTLVQRYEGDAEKYNF
jgi:hypothetical protein